MAIDNSFSNGHVAPNHSNGDTIQSEIPVTQIFAQFTSSITAEVLTPRIRERLKEYLLDFIGVTLAASHVSDSTEPICKAIAALGGQNGSCTVLGKGSSYTPQFAGLLNAALGHSLDFDDTHAQGTLHPGVTAIAAALTQAEILGSDTERFLLAITVGYEITCRLGIELGNEAYSRGFHNTATAGIFGAVASIAVLKQLPTEIVENAFGLAGSKAAGSMQYLENGSWNKRLHPGFAVHDAFVCVALAEAGVIGASKIIEGTFGFLNAYTPRKYDLNYLVADLGSRWEILETSLKPYPACRMTHGFIEHAAKIGCGKKPVKASDVKQITLSLSSNNIRVVGARTQNKIHPMNMVDAQFSAYFTTSNSFLYGSRDGVQCYKTERLADPEINALSDKIVCIPDDSVRQMGSKLKVEYEDGEMEQVDIPYPLGEKEHPFTKDQVDQKFFSLATPVLGESRALSVRDMVDAIENHSVGDLLQILQPQSTGS